MEGMHLIRESEKWRRRAKYICKKTKPTNAVDNCIYGAFKFNNTLYQVICAQMSVSVWNLGGHDCVQYSYTISPGKISQRGYAPSNKMLQVLYQSINQNYPQSVDTLFVYTELVAKHWGDLGLVFEVLSSDVYVLSQDRIIKILCNQFGCNYMDENFEYPAIIRALSDVLFTTETNTASAFGRY